MSLADEMVSVKALGALGEANLQKLAALARLQECPAGALLFREADNSTSIFVVLSGEVTLEVTRRDRTSAAIYTAGPGELIGWSPVLGQHAMTATARVTAPCRLAVFEVGRVNELIQKDPHFGVTFLRKLALIVSDRLSVTRHCLASVRDHFESPRFSILREGSD